MIKTRVYSNQKVTGSTNHTFTFFPSFVAGMKLDNFLAASIAILSYLSESDSSTFIVGL